MRLFDQRSQGHALVAKVVVDREGNCGPDWTQTDVASPDHSKQRDQLGLGGTQTENGRGP
jgi:hypothetical protein